MKKILFLVVLALCSLVPCQVFAVPAYPGLVETTQPDGSKISYYVRGDEKVHWMQSPDGYTLLFNRDKFLVYAEKNMEGNLAPSNYIYMEEKLLRAPALNSFLAETPKDLRYSESQQQTLMQIWEITESAIKTNPVKGNKKALCVLMGFPDKPITHSVAEFDALMNQAGYSANGAVGSVKDFYHENSYGQMDLTVTVVGPYVTPDSLKAYLPERQWPEFARVAAQAADVDVNFNDFANEAGQLETFHIIFAGYGDEVVGNGEQIWSHKYQLYLPLYLDGVRVSVYSCSPELRGKSGSEITSIGVICHELCHVFGAYDYYDTGSEGYLATGSWDLMAGGNWNGNGRERDGTSPAHINMFQKILYGWVEPVELTDSLTVTNMPNSTQNPVAYYLKPYTDSEMYILENRQRVGFDAEVPGNGLLIYHIHNTAVATGGIINNRTHPQQAYVVYSSSARAIPATNPSSYGTINTAGTPFTGMAGRDEFSGTSTPQMFRWNGSVGIPVMDKPLTEITQAGGLVSFNFKGGSPDAVLAFDPVSDLTGSVEYNSIFIRWNYPASGNYPTGYEVYRDNQLLVTLPVNIREYEDNDRATGNYTYCVKAVYPDGVSAAECVPVNFVQTYCLPAVQLNAQVQDNVIRLSWTAPSDAATQHYTYTVYANDKLAAQNIEATSYEYTPVAGGYYRFIVTAYTETCRAEDAEKLVAFHPELEFEWVEIPETVYTKHTYPFSVEVKENAFDEVISYDWSFSNGLATVVPDAEKPNTIQLQTGEQSGMGTLRVEIKYYRYTTVLTEDFVIDYFSGISEKTASSIAVYPNPVKDQLTVQVSDTAAVRVTDINGRTVYANPGFNGGEVDASHWAKGVYFIQIQTANDTRTEKIIKY